LKNKRRANVLLPDKTEESYTKVLRVVQEMADEYGIPNISPQKLKTDFELAIITSLKTASQTQNLFVASATSNK